MHKRMRNITLPEADEVLRRMREELMVKVCNECRHSVMKTHPELRFWLKCDVCGYCKKEAKRE